MFTNHILYMYKKDLELNNLQGLICHKIQPINSTSCDDNRYTMSASSAILYVNNALLSFIWLLWRLFMLILPLIELIIFGKQMLLTHFVSIAD